MTNRCNNQRYRRLPSIAHHFTGIWRSRPWKSQLLKPSCVHSAWLKSQQGRKNAVIARNGSCQPNNAPIALPGCRKTQKSVCIVVNGWKSLWQLGHPRVRLPGSIKAGRGLAHPHHPILPSPALPHLSLPPIRPHAFSRVNRGGPISNGKVRKIPHHRPHKMCISIRKSPARLLSLPCSCI